MNYNIFKSRTVWLIVFAFLYNGYAAISGQLPVSITVIVNGIFGILQAYFHVAGVQNAAVASAKATAANFSTPSTTAAPIVKSGQ